MQYLPIEREATNFQRPLTATQIEAMCRAAFGTNAVIQTVVELSSGMFNNTFVVEAKHEPRHILRVGPDKSVFVFQHEALLLRRENAIEPHLSVLSGLVPKTVFTDFSRRIIDRDYALQTYLEGELWEEAKESLSPETTESLWRQLGEISRKIHDVPGDRFGHPRPKPQFSRWSEAVIHIAEEMFADLRKLELDPAGVQEYIDLLRQGDSMLDEISQPRLLHGDLWPKNVLISRQGGAAKIVGLLDAERGMWGDPMAEWIFYFLDIPAAFWQAYGNRAQDAVAKFRANAYLGFYSVQILLETWRFGWDEASFREKLAKATTEMKAILANA